MRGCRPDTGYETVVRITGFGRIIYGECAENGERELGPQPTTRMGGPGGWARQTSSMKMISGGPAITAAKDDPWAFKPSPCAANAASSAYFS